MTTSDSPYVTRDELAARLAELELRFERRINEFEQRMNDHFKTQTRMLIGLYATIAVAAFVIAVKG